ncbi:uncharacterized protein HMPREF1541_01864 [Cyphellophora europaea CBS 101466]|uniref:Uncharacterized protein n=1 Tax=Cyphellophora europaea (strain CBS 101466) TaxID=1220924 RepID=W2S1W1_CYPE1|nr:uncharacterized protein HMPREF1541_01864 [Cyphellophora europaea CBS 101466]ETN42706.1 hypothetical protein HMPREF1541_01864 [Cyphellophora europaea CBS 101466]
MPGVALPPMTTRQAKRAARKSTAQFKYSASQMRRADRIDELEERRKNLEDKDRKRKLNQRKRDEQAIKDREAQRKLLTEGKISVEDTWGKVTASQPRLNTFFTKKISGNRQSVLNESANVENKANGLASNNDEAVDKAFDSQDTLVARGDVPHGVALPILDEVSDADLLKLLPSPSPPGKLTPAQLLLSCEISQHKTTVPRSAVSLSSPSATPDKMSSRKRKQRPSSSPESTPERALINPAARQPSFEIFEDNAEATEPLQPQIASYYDTARSNDDGNIPTTVDEPRVALAVLSDDQLEERDDRIASGLDLATPPARNQQHQITTFQDHIGADDESENDENQENQENQGHINQDATPADAANAGTTEAQALVPRTRRGANSPFEAETARNIPLVRRPAPGPDPMHRRTINNDDHFYDLNDFDTSFADDHAENNPSGTAHTTTDYGDDGIPDEMLAAVLSPAQQQNAAPRRFGPRPIIPFLVPARDDSPDHPASTSESSDSISDQDLLAAERRLVEAQAQAQAQPPVRGPRGTRDSSTPTRRSPRSSGHSLIAATEAYERGEDEEDEDEVNGDEVNGDEVNGDEVKKDEFFDEA